MNQQFNLMRFTTAGFEFTAIVVALAGCGFLLDSKLGTIPVFTAIGAVLGVVAAIYRLIRQAKQMQDEFSKHQNDDASRDKDRPGRQ